MNTNENLEILFCLRFRNGKANKFPQLFFCFRFRNDHVGHNSRPQLRDKLKSPRFSFAFAFVIQQREIPKFLDFYLFSLVIVSVRMVAFLAKLEVQQAIALAIASQFCRKLPFARNFRREDEMFAISFAKPFAQSNFSFEIWRRIKFFEAAPLQKCVGDFCCINFGGFCRGFSWRIFLGTFSPQKWGEKIRRQNPRKNLAAQK